MSDVYRPGWESQTYRLYSRDVRRAIAAEVDRRFRKKTGVHRQLHPTAPEDRKLRRIWLRIRDDVVNKREEAADEAWHAPGGEADQIEDERTDELLTDIPYEMRLEGWKEGAELLETWFERPPIIKPAFTAPVTDVIKMDWVLGFARARRVFDSMVAQKIWTGADSRARLAAILRTARPRAGTYGDLRRSAIQLDAAYVSSASVSSGTAVDGLMAALGAFTLRAAVAGKVVQSSANLVTLEINEVGIYVWDSFDFNGNQFLGIWGYRDQPVGNGDFRQWRGQHHQGGDFLVFSDVKRVPVNPPDVVAVNL